MKNKKQWAWAAAVGWMAVIFILSHQPGTASSQLSSSVTEVIIETVETVLPQAGGQIGDIHTIVRKNAHFFAYFLLGMLLLNALRRSGMSRSGSLGWAFAGAVVYAMTDEFHQLFIEGRSGEWRDVLIDSAGAAVGLAVYQFVSSIRGKWKRRKNG